MYVYTIYIMYVCGWNLWNMFVYNMKYVLIKDKKKRTCNIIFLFFNQCYGIIVALFKILHCLECFPGDGQRASCLLCLKMWFYHLYLTIGCLNVKWITMYMLYELLVSTYFLTRKDKEKIDFSFLFNFCWRTLITRLERRSSRVFYLFPFIDFCFTSLGCQVYDVQITYR